MPARRARGRADAPAAPLPATFAPQLAAPVAIPPDGGQWLHEIKLDGYRMGCRIDHGQVSLLGRRGTKWSDKFPELCRAAAALPVATALLDGEVAVVDSKGQSHFGHLQELLAGGPRTGLVYFAFDLLHVDGQDLSSHPLEVRKQRLVELLGTLPSRAPIRSVTHIVGNGPAVFAEARRMGLEGTVSKRVDGPYQPGRGPGWQKAKCSARQEVVIGGFTYPRGQRAGVGALLCGYYDGAGALSYAGKVGTGFTADVLGELRRGLEPLEQETCPFTPPPAPLIRRDARWVRPVLVAEVRFSNWTSDGRLRHGSFEGLRADKRARDVRRETPSSSAP